MATKRFLTREQSSIAEARAAYLDGDYEICLQICSEVRVRSLAAVSELALLRARAYLHLGHYHEAETAVVEKQHAHATPDASLTAQMLLGIVRIRQADPEGGIALLAAAAQRSAGTHFAIRSEIAFATALGYYTKGDVDAAERHLSHVDRRSDIVHARALELSAWCQAARGNYRRCAEFFILTLLRLDNCRAHDRAIVATAISTLSILAAELFDRELAHVAQYRARVMHWTPGLVMQQYLTLLHQALFAEMTGNTVEAYELAIQAHNIAPTVAFEAFACSVIAAVARNADEGCTAVVYAKHARQLLVGLDLGELEGEERFSILAVAESCAHFDPASADRLFAVYWGLAPADKMIALGGDPRLAAEETLIAGVIAETRGDAELARRCYRKAFEDFERLGYVRRAVMVALALVKLGGEDSMRRYLTRQCGGASNYITRYLAGAFDDRCVQRSAVSDRYSLETCVMATSARRRAEVLNS